MSAQAILDYIDGLPRNSNYHAALADDEELAAVVLAEEDADAESAQHAPRLTDFGTVEALLTDIKDLLRTSISVQANWGSGKSIKPPVPSPRPVTAAQRVRRRQEHAQHERLKAALLPRRYGPEAQNT